MYRVIFFNSDCAGDYAITRKNKQLMFYIDSIVLWPKSSLIEDPCPAMESDTIQTQIHKYTCRTNNLLMDSL